MNRKGNMYFGIIIGIFVFVTGVLFIPFITDDITTARNNLQCSSPTTITSGTMLTCLLFSSLTPYLIWFFVSLLLGFIVGGTT